MKKKLILGIVTLGVLVVGFITFMFMPGNINNEQAVEIALEHVGGGVANRADRDFEAFRRVWSVEVFYENMVHEVFVHRNSGEVLRIERDFD